MVLISRSTAVSSVAVLHYVRKYASYLDVLRFRDTRTSDLALKVCDRHTVWHNTDAGRWVRRWLSCGGCGMSALCCVRSEVDSPIVHC